MKRNKIFLIIGIILLLCSVGLIFYPTLSQHINNQLAKGAIKQYDNQVNSLTEERKNKYLKEAEKYNQNLSNVVSDSFSPDAFRVSEEYTKILSVTDDGLIGSVFIPKIDCNLPIYHGSSEKELNKGAVHMANTSFPIGGESTHAVISAHTAYPGKEFFNRLTELEKNDLFTIKVLDDTLCYKVTDIFIVLPHDSERLRIVTGKDLCTLVTCTPYSVNTHRLLVRGERIYPAEMTTEEKETLKKKSYDYTIWILLIICIILIIVLLSFMYHRHRIKDKMMKRMIKRIKKATPDEIKSGGSGAGAARSILIYPYNNSGEQNEKE